MSFNRDDYIKECIDSDTYFKFKPYSVKYLLALNSNINLKFYKDELTLKYVGKGISNSDFASTQSNYPISKENACFYYESIILDLGVKEELTIGFADKDFVLQKQCGQTSKSYGVSVDGKKYHNKPKGEIFISNKIKANDIIGCGYNFSNKSIFYTLNGNFLGNAFTNVNENINIFYPTISLHSTNETLKLNFGSSPFMFDIESYCIQKEKENIESLNMFCDSNNFYNFDYNFNQQKSSSEFDFKNINFDENYLIKEYLIHCGYKKTFNVLDSEKNKKAYDVIINENKQLLKVIEEENLDVKDEEHKKKLRKLSEDIIAKEDNNISQNINNRELSFLINKKKFDDNDKHCLVNDNSNINKNKCNENETVNNETEKINIITIMNLLDLRNSKYNIKINNIKIGIINLLKNFNYINSCNKNSDTVNNNSDIIVDNDFEISLDRILDDVFKSQNIIYIKLYPYLFAIKYLYYIGTSQLFKAFEQFNYFEEKYLNLINKNNSTQNINSNSQNFGDLVVNLSNEKEEIKEYNLFTILSLICFSEPNKCHFNFLLRKSQFIILSDQINSVILNICGMNSESIIESVVKHNEMLSLYKESI